MKKLFAGFLALTLCGTLFAASPWVGAEGTVNEYEIKDAKDKVTGYAQTTVKNVVDMGFQTRIEMETSAFDKNKKMIKDATKTTVYVIANDKMTLDLNSLFPAPEDDSVTFTFRGDEISYPLTVEVGDKLTPYYITIVVDFQDPATGIWYEDMEYLTIEASRREVVAKENIETEAGSFECYKYVEEGRMSSTMMDFDESSNGATWYADGIGVVKVESYDRKGNVSSTQTLISTSK